MKFDIKNIASTIFIGKKYNTLTSVDDQVRYITMNFVFMVGAVFLSLFGVIALTGSGMDFRVYLDFGIGLVCIIALIFVRRGLRSLPFLVSIIPFGFYCTYLTYIGTLNGWVAVWVFAYPVVAIFLGQLILGVILSVVVLITTSIVLYVPGLALNSYEFGVAIRYTAVYVLLLILAGIYERIRLLKDKKEKLLSQDLIYEKDTMQMMKDNMQQGIFLIDKDLNIQPEYSKTLITILSYYGDSLVGKNLLDLIANSLNQEQLGIMKKYFDMIYGKTKSLAVLESANPISDFEYKIEDRSKILSTRFRLIEKSEKESYVLCIFQDITREKEFEAEVKAEQEKRDVEMKNLFDVIQVDPLVFRDFIEDTDSNFNYINEVLKDRTLTEREAVTKFFQNIHAIKSNALILGLENFGLRLHEFEDEIKNVSSKETISFDDMLKLTVRLEEMMRIKDEYMSITKRIESFKTSNQIDMVLVQSLTKAVERTSADVGKKVEFKVGQMDRSILESSLRKPLKDILFQFVRNSIYHGIEDIDTRIKNGKRPIGLITLTVKNVDGNAEIVFADDGGGLNYDKIKGKYLKLHPGTNPDKKVLTNAVFSPEFSTAEETSNVAGRGVGLSLVKDLVAQYKGKITIGNSDKGLTYKVIFPL
ncbi:hypothetical protein AGMMS50293_05150 [Spirochaetia bacterium]|nr:hypothetical protein AGMMS50293_05150 [Spirochaetia bacterium]